MARLGRAGSSAPGCIQAAGIRPVGQGRDQDMLFWMTRSFRNFRKRRGASLALILLLVLAALLGNSACFYFFEAQAHEGLTWLDAVWYSIVSISTIGYGDYFPQTTGGRLGAFFFIILVGLSAFSGMLGLLVDWMVEMSQRELMGLSTVPCRNHVILVNFPGEARVRQILEELRLDEGRLRRDVVIVSERIERLPFALDNVFFVHGSPLQEETFRRARLEQASVALVLCTDPADLTSDGVVASVVTMIEHLRPDIKTVAECLDERHRVLFESTSCDSIVYSNRVVNHLLVQESCQSGVACLVEKLTDQADGDSLFCTAVGQGAERDALPFACALLAQDLNVMGVTRDGVTHTRLKGLRLREGDEVLYVGARRYAWEEMAALGA